LRVEAARTSCHNSTMFVGAIRLSVPAPLLPPHPTVTPVSATLAPTPITGPIRYLLLAMPPPNCLHRTKLSLHRSLTPSQWAQKNLWILS
jgi:hypothetical protein